MCKQAYIIYIYIRVCKSSIQPPPNTYPITPPTPPIPTTKQDWLVFSGQGISCDGGIPLADAGTKYMAALTVFLILFVTIGTCWCVWFSVQCVCVIL